MEHMHVRVCLSGKHLPFNFCPLGHSDPYILIPILYHHHPRKTTHGALREVHAETQERWSATHMAHAVCAGPACRSAALGLDRPCRLGQIGVFFLCPHWVQVGWWPILGAVCEKEKVRRCPIPLSDSPTDPALQVDTMHVLLVADAQLTDPRVLARSESLLRIDYVAELSRGVPHRGGGFGGFPGSFGQVPSDRWRLLLRRLGRLGRR